MMKRFYSNALLILALLAFGNHLSAQNTCGAPMVISSLPYTGTGLTTCGKVNDYQNFCSEANYMDGEDYIFSYTPTASGCINIKLTGTSNWTGVFLFSGCPNAGGTCIGKMTSSTGNPNLGQMPVVANTTYYIIVDTYPTPNCTPFNISVTNCPAGSSCASPKVIPALPFTETNTTCGAGADYGSFQTAYGSCGPTFNDDGEDLVYSYTAPRNQCINVSVTGWTYPDEAAFTISKLCPTASNAGCIAVSEATGTAGPPAVNGIQIFAGTTIYITIDSDDFSAGCQPFKIKIDTCATTVPQCSTSPPASDFCSSATPICDFTGYCGSTSSTYTIDQPSNINNVFCGSIENNSWVKFVAGATTASFNVWFGNCSNGDGIQALVLEATNCANFVVKSNCYEPISASGNGVITATNLVVGNTYLIMVDGYAGDQCDYILQANSGVLLPVSAGPDVTICPGKSTTLTASNGNNVYSWSPGGQTSKSITVSPGVTTDYIVTSASGNIGCPTPDTDTVRVTVTPTIVANLTSVVNANSCNATCDGSASVSVSGGQTPYSNSWSHGPTTTSVSSLCPGTTYNFTATDNLGCKSTVSVTMPPPVIADVNFTAPPCGTTTVTLVPVASSGTGVFTYTGPGTLNITNAGGGNYTATTSTYGSYDVTWTVTDGACSRAVTKTIEFRETPVANFTVTSPLCGSKTTTLTTTSTVGTGGFTFSGPGAVTFTNTGGNNYSATATNFGTYNITWVVSNSGCNATITKTVTFTDQPVSAFTINPPACNSLTFSVSTTASPGSGAWTYTGPSGSVLNFTSAGTNAYNATASQYGTYNITWTVTNSSCSANSTQSVTFDKQPVANAGLDQNICGLSTSLAATPSVGSGLWAQISGPATATIATLTSANSAVTAPTYGTYGFRWSEVNGNCPPSTDDVIIVFSQDPAGNAGPDQSVCGFTANLAGTASIGTGVWSGSGISSPTNANTAVSTASAGSKTFTWTVSNGGCPPITDNVTVDFYKTPTPNAGPDQSVCGLNVTLNGLPATSAGQWIAPASASFGAVSNPKSTASVSAYGSYFFVWEESNGPCPLSRDTVQIVFVETPSPNAGADQAICGLSTSFAASPSAFTGSWTGPGSIANPGSRTSAVTAPGYGSYSYVWSEFNAAPCPGKTDTVVLTFTQQTVANAGPDKNVCGNSSSLAAVKSVSGSTGTWTGPAGVVYGNVNSPTTGIVVPAYGVYTFTWTEANGSVCPNSSDQVTINFVQPSNPDAGPDNGLCGSATTLGAVPSFGTGTWSYVGPGILTFSDINDPHANINSNTFGLYNLAWTEGASPCIANTDTVVVQFNEPPVVDAGLSPDKVCGLEYRLNAYASVGQTKWSWTPASGVLGNISFQSNADTIPSPKITASAYGEYYLIWKATNGPCQPPADTVALTFYEKPHPDAGPDIKDCDTLQAQLNGITSIVGQWQWNSPSGGTLTFSPDAFRPDPIAQASVPGTYKLFFSELNDPVCGTVTDSLTLDFLQKPSASAGPDANACGNNFILAGNAPAVGIGKWTLINSSDPSYTATFADDTQNNTQVTLNNTPPATGVTLTFRWTVGNGNCIPVFDDVDIVFTAVPNSVDAGADQLICNTLTSAITANDFGGTGTWQIISKPSGAIASVDVPSSQNANLTSDKYGLYLVQRTVNVSGCPDGVVDVVAIDFRRLPTPFAGLDDTICGPDFTMAGTASGGRTVGKWSQISGPGTASFLNDSLVSSGVSVPSGQYGLYTFQWLESNLGCPNVPDDVQILFEEQPTAVAGLDFAVCGLVYDLDAVASTAASSPDYIGQWTMFSGPGTVSLAPTDGKNPKSQLTASAFGKYVMVWSEINGICPLSSDTVNLQFVNPSNPNAGPDKDICGLQDTLGAQPSYGIGEWISAGTNPGTVSFVNKADPASIIGVSTFGTYRFDWLEANSPCFANSDFAIMTFHEQPLSAAGFDADTCSLTYQLKATPSVSGPDYVGTWSGPVGSIFSNVNDPNALVDVSSVGYGKHKFIWTEVNGTTCSASVDAVDITFIQTPLADIGIVPATVCGKSVNLKAVPSVGVGQWSSNDPNKFNYSNPTTAPTTGVADNFGQYTLYWKETNFGTNGGSCSSIDSAVIFMSPQPSTYAGRDSAICGNTIVLNATQSVPASVVSWSLIGNPADANFSPVNNKNTTVTTNNKYGVLNFVFKEDIGNGTCVSTDTVAVNFVQQPVADAGMPDSVCSLTANLTAIPSVGNGSWSSISSGVVFNPDLSKPNPSISASNYGVYKFVWKEDNGAPCVVSRDTVTIGFFKVPVPKAGNDFSVCGTVATLNAVPGSYPGSWSYSGPLSVSFVNPTDPKTKATLAPGTSGDYGLLNFTWTENNVVCPANDQLGVYYSEQPNANAGPDQNLCGKDFTLTAVPSVGNGHWEYPGNDTNLTGFFNQNNANAYGTVAHFGQYQFNWIEQNPGICPADTDQTALMFNRPPVASAGPDSNLCSMSHRLTATRSVGTGSWTKISGAGTVSFVDNTKDTTIVTVSSAGTYLFSWREFNSASCPISSDTVQIYFEQAPVAKAGPDFSICGSAGNLAATPSIGTGQWTFIGDPAATVSFGNATSATSLFSSNKFGAHPLIWSEINTAVCGQRTDTVVVTFVQQPIAQAGLPVYNICGSSMVLEAVPTVGIGQWSQVSGTGTGNFSSIIDPKALFTAANTGNSSYTLRWTEDNGTPCTVSTDDVVINFFKQPIADAGLPKEICGLTGTLAAVPSIGTGNWVLNVSGTQSALFFDYRDPATSVTVNEYGDYQFVWREQNGNVCPADQDVVLVSFMEAPKANAGPDQIICGLGTQLSSTNTSGSGVWFLPSGSPLLLSDSSSNTSNVSSSAFGNFAVIWAESNGKACPVSLDTMMVQFNQQPLAVAGPDANVCGQSHQFNAIPSYGIGTWTTSAPGAVFSPSIHDPKATVTITGYGIFIFTWTENNSNTCVPSSDSLQVQFIQGPSGNISVNPVSTCAGDSVDLTLNLTGTGPYDVTYTTNGGSPVSLTNVSNGYKITVNPLITTSYQITQIEDGSVASCKSGSTTPVTVTVNPRPKGIVTGNYSICDKDSLTIPVSFTGTPPFRAKFSNSEEKTFNGNGPYYYTYLPGAANTLGITYVNDSNCVGTADPALANVQINELPAGTLTKLGGNICAGNTVDFRLDFSKGIAPWTVYVHDGSRTKAVQATTNGFIIQYTPSVGTTTYTIDSIIDGNGCHGTGGSASVLVYENPAFVFTADTIICENTSSMVTFNFTPSGSGPWIVDYNYNSTTTSTSALNDGGTISLSPTGTTTYHFTKVTDNATGCFAVDDQLVEVVVVPTPTLTASLNKAEICRNESAVLTFKFAGIEPFDVTLNNGSSFSGLKDGSTINVSPTMDTMFQVVNFKDGSGITCPANINVNVPLVVNQLPPVQFQITGTSSCAPMLPVFANLTNPAYIAANGGCFWDFGDGNTSTDINPTHEYMNSGNYNVRLIVTSDKGCKDTLDKVTKININPDPVAGFVWSPEFPTLVNNEVHFTNASVGAKTYNWNIGNLMTTSVSNPTYMFPSDDSATYVVCLTATSDSGCVNIHCERIYITGEMSVFVPSAFTPDGDGINDVWMPVVLGSDLTSYELLVFDRWGEVIFTATDPTKGWDGTVQGTIAKTDVYTWKLNFKDKYSVNRHEYIGKVTLIK